MQHLMASFGECRVEILLWDEQFLGLGAIFIGETQVRSGRLPLHPYTQTFTGHELTSLRFLGMEQGDAEVRIKLEAHFRPLPVKLLRDHSFDPIHDLGDWDVPPVSGTGRLDLVLRPADDSFEGVAFHGFSYHYEYESASVPLFYLLDFASWELDGDIAGATVISQSSCSAPVVTFAADTRWTTEGVVHWEDEHTKANPVMTHNLPRWASHQSFDFQYKGDRTLIGVFERVELIRTVIMREAGKAELKTADKHLFDQALSISTSAKKILLNDTPKREIDQQNIWTWVFDAVADRARAEFGLREEPLVPRLSQNYADNFTIDTYWKDLLPAAINLGFQALFIDNVNKNAATERCPHPDFHWNECCGHEYEPAPRLGGAKALTAFMQECTKHGIRPFSWTNNDQAHSSPIQHKEQDGSVWFVRMEDTRLRYGGAYMGVFCILDFKSEAPRRYWVDCLKRIKEETGLDGYLFDSFYNLGFMPINYRDVTPTTQWRELLMAFKELQAAGISFLIESFGPFGSPQHGCPSSYAQPENIFTLYKVTGGFDYTTIPTNAVMREFGDDAMMIYLFLAHMASPSFPLFLHGRRLDAVWTDKHKQALADYNNNREHMRKRYLQQDGLSVLWHDAAGKRATVWNFAERDVRLPGGIRDLSAGIDLPQAELYHLLPCHTYAITADVLPIVVASEASD